jgi:hypothetical protein
MKIFTKIAVFLLKSSKISLEDKQKLTNAILIKLSALPLRDIIQVNESGTLTVNGKELDREATMVLRESAIAALQSRALGLVRDQVLYTSFVLAANKSINNEQLYFAKAAVWWQQEVDKILKSLASIGEPIPE